MATDIERILSNGRQTLMLIHDDEGENPREWNGGDGTDGHMICFHNHYQLGDKHDYDCPNDFLQKLCAEVIPMESFLEKIKGIVHVRVMESDDGYFSAQCLEDFEWTNITDFRWQKDEIPLLEECVSELSNEELLSLLQGEIVYQNLYLLDHSGLSMSCSDFGDPWDSGQVGIIYNTKEEVIANYCDFSEESQKTELKFLKDEVKIYDDYLTGNEHGFRYFEGTEEKDSCWGYLGDLDEIVPALLAENGMEFTDDEKVIDETCFGEDIEIEGWLLEHYPDLYEEQEVMVPMKVIGLKASLDEKMAGAKEQIGLASQEKTTEIER